MADHKRDEDGWGINLYVNYGRPEEPDSNDAVSRNHLERFGF